MHPPEEVLLAFASGQADLPRRVMVEGHLDTCAVCRRTVGELNSSGGALVAGLREEAPPAWIWERLRVRIESTPQGAPPNPHLRGLPLPQGAVRELPDLGALRWRWALARGARYALLARDRFAGSVLLLACMPPGRFYPQHIHEGPEDVLVLVGGYEDQRGHYEAGEYACYEPGSGHRPLTAPDEECWVLTRLEAPNRFLGWRGWLQRLA